MGITVCLSAMTLFYPTGGGHLWVYLNWALGLRALGCQVIWLEGVAPNTAVHQVPTMVDTLKRHLAPYGLAECVALCSLAGEPLSARATQGCLDLELATEADLLLNMRYDMDPQQVQRFRRSALVDIDPGLLQVWMSTGRVNLARHDTYFTIGETVGTPSARFPDGGLRWHYTPPPVFLPAWPLALARHGTPYTTVAHLWGEEMEFQGEVLSTEKRTSFLDYVTLPSRTSVSLELALCLRRKGDKERGFWEENGWQVQHAWDVAATPGQYQAYIQCSRGEFSCAKPSCMQLENAWISDRTLCYLASGKPAVVQHTGPSRFLPDAAGLLRFRTLEEAVRALSVVESAYEWHCQAARALAEEYFDARKVVQRVLEVAIP
jgi:hypothetical protein